MSDLFSNIAKMIPTMDGWCSISKAFTMASAVIALRPQVSVEIGVYGGRSFLPMAMAHKEIGSGMAIGIDPWSSAASEQGQSNPQDRQFWSTLDHDKIYNSFMRFVASSGVQQCCNIIRSKSDDVAPPAVIDIFHLDGNHSDQAVKDIARFAPNIRIGGMAFIDDIHWSGGGVERAVEKLKGFGFVRLYDLDSGAAFQKVS